MNETFDPRWEARLVVIAAGLVYPPTPDLVRRLSLDAAGAAQRPLLSAAPRRVWAYAAIVLAVLAVGVLVVPQARASLVEFFRFGAIRFTLGGPTATPSPTPRPAVPTPTGPVLSGRTTLAEAEAQTTFSILLPAYPENLGLPDEVYFQHFEGQVALTLWRHADGSARLALYHVTERDFVLKAVQVIERTVVDGIPAVWARGPHFVHFQDSTFGQIDLVAGDILIWTVGGVTYRLESDLPLAEAVRIAESLH
jgi:hypothetical protein